jgi:hypothetical protein
VAAAIGTITCPLPSQRADCSHSLQIETNGGLLSLTGTKPCIEGTPQNYLEKAAKSGFTKEAHLEISHFMLFGETAQNDRGIKIVGVSVAATPYRWIQQYTPPPMAALGRLCPATPRVETGFYCVCASLGLELVAWLKRCVRGPLSLTGRHVVAE